MVSAVLLFTLFQEPTKDRVEYTFVDDAVQVTVGGEPFATLNYTDVARPFIYPLYGPGGVQILRNYPMVEGVEGESSDHPHHTGVWFGHGDMNGADVWHRDGRLVIDSRPSMDPESIVLELDMLQEDGSKFGRCLQLFQFKQLDDGSRVVDYWIHIIPEKGGSLKFGDTKEGMMGVRTHPKLRLDRPTGHVLNSEGIDDKSVWGKRAKWIDYWGEIDGKTSGIAMFDHPNNLRHPTWWHARDYGLFAANPFGISAFEGKPAGAGKMELKVDETVMFKYRIVLHKGSAQDAGIENLYRNWTDGK